jgi:hypothetical protein
MEGGALSKPFLLLQLVADGRSRAVSLGENQHVVFYRTSLHAPCPSSSLRTHRCVEGGHLEQDAYTVARV